MAHIAYSTHCLSVDQREEADEATPIQILNDRSVFSHLFGEIFYRSDDIRADSVVLKHVSHWFLQFEFRTLKAEPTKRSESVTFRQVSNSVAT